MSSLLAHAEPLTLSSVTSAGNRYIELPDSQLRLLLSRTRYRSLLLCANSPQTIEMLIEILLVTRRSLARCLGILALKLGYASQEEHFPLYRRLALELPVLRTLRLVGDRASWDIGTKFATELSEKRPQVCVVYRLSLF